MRSELRDLGVIRRHDHPKLAGAIDAAHRRGELRRLLPGVYAHADLGVGWQVLVWAASVFDRDCVVIGEAACALGWGRPYSGGVVVASHRRQRSSTELISFEWRSVPDEVVWEAGKCRFASPAYSAVELIPRLGGAVVDEVLREFHRDDGVLQQMWTALAAHPGRPGNRERRQILADSCDRPWSAAERRAHQVLRRAGFTGWVTNHHVRVGKRDYFIDVAFPQLRIAVEVDGWEFHSSRGSFGEDRHKSNDLTAEGWLVLRVTWEQLEHELETWLIDVIGLRR